MRVVLLGAPGAGKGTHCKRIVDRYGVLHLSSGDILRRERAQGSDLGKKAQSYMDAGALVPDDLIVKMMSKAVKEAGAAGYVLDGFPRTVNQAETLDRIIAVVNGEIILYSELQEQIRQLAKLSPDLNMEDPARRAQIEREILQQMIRDHLADQEIKRLKIVVTPREIDESIEGIKQENHFTEAQFDYVIQQQGLTRDQFRKQVKKEMERSRLIDRVLKSKTIVTPEQIEAYLKDGQGGFIERRRLAIIVVPYPEGADKQKAEQIDKLARDIMGRLKGGADFSKMAKVYSKGPAA